MNRINDLDVITFRDAAERDADVFEALAETFAAVARDQNQFFGGVQKIEAARQAFRQARICLDFLGGFQQRIDHGVAGDIDVFCRYCFGEQVLFGLLGRGEVISGNTTRQAPVHFFRPRRVDIACAQAGFDVRDIDLLVVRGKACCECSGCIAVHQHQVRFAFGEYPLQTTQHANRDLGEILAVFHQIQVKVGFDREKIKNLVEH